MSIKVRAVYDGNALLQLKEPLNIPPDTEVQITIEPSEDEDGQDYSFFRYVRSNAIDGPSDWSTRYEEYLYPDPPRSHRDDDS